MKNFFYSFWYQRKSWKWTVNMRTHILQLDDENIFMDVFSPVELLNLGFLLQFFIGFVDCEFFCCFWKCCENELFCTSDILILEKDIKIGIYSGVINICILSCDGKFFLCEKTEKVVRALEWGVGSRELWNCWVEIRFIWGAKKKKKIEASSRSSTISSF